MRIASSKSGARSAKSCSRSTERHGVRRLLDVKRTGSRALVLAIAAAVFPRVAHAAGDARAPVTLEWSAPSGCPSHDEMVDRIARIVGDAVPTEPLAVRAIVTGEAGGTFAADVTMTASAQSNARHFDASSCAAVSDAVALVVALAVNPRAIEDAHEAQAIAPRPASSAIAPPAAVAPSSSRRAFAIGASAIVDANTLPSAAFGAELLAGWTPRHAIVEASLAYVASETARLASSPNEGADFTLVHLGARGCYAPFDARFDIGPCAGAGLEWIAAHGFGALHPSDATGRMGIVSLGFRAIAHITPGLALRLGADGIAPFARPTFVIDNGGQVFQAAPLLFRASFGIELHF